jgi:transposase InsO family protein
MHTMEYPVMHAIEQLASEQIRSNPGQAEQLRHARRHRTLRRARQMEHKAERRMIQLVPGRPREPPRLVPVSGSACETPSSYKRLLSSSGLVNQRSANGSSLNGGTST